MRVKSQSAWVPSKKENVYIKEAASIDNMGWQEQKVYVSGWNLRMQPVKAISESFAIWK